MMLRGLFLGIGLWIVSATGAFAVNCTTYPYTFVNGAVIQAAQFNSNFNTIRDCANNNLAAKGANSDITSLTGLTTPLGSAFGGTGLATIGNSGNSIVSNGAIYSLGIPIGIGSISGLALSNNGSDATNDIDVAAGWAADSTGAYGILLASGLTKQLDAAWVVGTNQGCRDTGAIANGTWHIFVIRRTDTGVSDILCSTSATAPTMPANYTYKRRIGSILRESAAIVPFSQNGNQFWRNTPIRDVNATSSGTSAVTRTLSVPTGIIVTAIVNATWVSNTGAYAYLSPLTGVDLAASATAPTIYGDTNITAVNQSRVPTNTSGQIRSRQSAGGASQTLGIITVGWVDDRGQF